jgi:hypothetical protein
MSAMIDIILLKWSGDVRSSGAVSLFSQDGPLTDFFFIPVNPLEAETMATLSGPYLVS